MSLMSDAIKKSVFSSISVQAPQKEEEGFLDNLMKGAKSQGAGVYSGLAGWIGGENAATDYLNKVVDDNRRSREFDGYSLDYITDPSGLAYDFGGLLGSQLALLPAYFIPGGGVAANAAARGAARLLGSGFAKNAASKIGAEAALASKAAWAGSEAGQKAIGTLARYGVTSAPIEALSEGGQGVTRAFQENLDNPYAVGAEITAKNLPLLLASNTLEAATLGRGLLRAGGKAGEGLGRRAAMAVPRATPYALAQGLQQSAEEIMQERAQEEAFGEQTGGILPSTWTPNEAQAFQDTFAAGSLMGLIGGTPGGFRVHRSGTGSEDRTNGAPSINTSNSGNAGIDPDADAARIQDLANAIRQGTGAPASQNQSQHAPQQAAQSRSAGTAGEFDSRFTKWESSPGATNLDGVRPEVKAAANAVMAEYGDGLTITGGAEKGYHAAGEHGHEGGWKIDIDKDSVKDKDRFLALCAKYGFQVGDEGDHYDLSGHSESGVGGQVVANPGTFVNMMGQAPTQRDGDSNAWAIYDVFRNAGYSDNAIAGILGRVQQEHNFDTSNVEEYDDADGRHLGGYGMFQWNGGRTEAFLNWAKENNLDPQDASAQAQYALVEAQQRGLTPDRMNNLSVEGAADLWTDEWEVGERGNERQYAAEWMNRIQNGGQGTAGPASDTMVPAVQEQGTEDLAQMLQSLDGSELTRENIGKILDMAQEQMETAQGLSPEQEANYVNFMQQAIQKEDLAAIARVHPREVLQILTGNRKPAQQGQKALPAPKIETQTKNLDRAKNRPQQNLLRNQTSIQHMVSDIQQIVNGVESGRITGEDARAQVDAIYQNYLHAGRSGNGTANEVAKEQHDKAVQAIEGVAPAETPEATKADELAAANGNVASQATKGETADRSRSYQSIYRAAMKPAEKGTPKEELKKQGRALLHVAKENGIELERKLQTALRNGYRNGLTEAQRQIRSAIWDGRQEIAYQNAEKGMRETADRYRQGSITRAEAERSIQSHISGFFGSGDNVIDGNRMDRLRNLADSILEENAPTGNVASEATNEGGENSAQNPTLQDRVNDLRGNPKGTRVESVKASEIASIINSAGERSAQNQDSSSNRNSIAANERESYQAAYDRMKKAREDYRSGKMPAAKAREEINAAYGQYVRGTFVMDARHHHNLRDMVEGFEKEDVERATSGLDGNDGKSNRQPEGARSDTQRTGNEITQSKHSESQGASSIGEESAQNQQEGKKEDFIFGDRETANREMLEALGLSDEDLEEDTLSAPEGIENTAAERERLEKEFAAELNKIGANPVFNPKLYSIGLKLAMTYVKDGINTAKKLIATLNAKFGSKVEPWSVAIAETVRTWPNGVPFNEAQVMAISKAVGAAYEGGATSLDEVQAEMKKVLKGKHKTFAPMVEASYNGIRKFFDEREAARNGEETRRNVETGQGESQGASGGYRDVESGELSGADEERGRGGTERTAATPGSEPQSRARDEAGDTRTDGRSGDAGGSGRKRVGSKDDRSGNGAGSNQQSVLKEDPSKDGDKPAEVPGHNFHITKASGIGEGGEKTKFKQNIEAIKLLKKLEAEGRRATPEEQSILAKFNGWGTVKSAFSNSKDWEKEYAQLKELLTPEEYKEAGSASLNAFYTSPELVNAIWKGVERIGFKGGRVLDPSMGTGNFFGMMPLDMANASSLHGVEKDSLTGRLAKQLYQKADVQVAGFEETNLPNNFFDLAISNVPFGETTPFDRAYEKTSTGENVRYRIHNYFFAKAMDKVRPGGLVAFITGPGTMQTTSKEANLLRLEMGRKADLVAAFKLPGNAFEKNAGTSVTTDVLILQKRVNPRQPAKYAQKWDEVGTINIKDPQRSGIYDYGTNFNLNEYYQKHPDNMIGKPVADKLFGGRDRMGLDGKGLDVGKELSKRMGKLPKDIYAPAKVKQHSTPESTKKFLSEPGTLERSYVMKDGKPYQNIGGELNEVPSKSAKAVVAYCKLRSALNAVLKAQIDPAASDTVIEKLRKELNKAYDSFVEDHGYVNAKKNVSVLGDDPMYGQVAAVEKYEYDKDAKTEKASKTDIFTKRTVGAIREISSADSPTDALTASIAQMGKVDIPYMANLLGKSEKETIQALGDLVYENPSTGQQELVEEYLSGNVRAKLAEAETAAKTNPAYKRNVTALKKVQPVDYTEHDIKANIGAPWIPAEVYQGFTKHMVGVPLEIKHEKLTNTWKVGTNWGADHTKMFNTWGTSSLPFNELLERILGMKEIQVNEKTKDGNTIVNTEATAAAVAKAEEVQAEFEKWLWSEEGRKTELLKSYNKLFNSEVERNYDGSALTFPGLVSHIRGKLYPHQKNAIWRMMQGGNTLIAHCVGAGKTWEMQIAGMEMKRVGICRKPMYVVPNNIVEQFRKEFYETYPNAKLLVLTSKDLPGAKLGGGADTFTEKLDTTKHKKTKGGKAQKKEKEEAGKRQERLNKRRAALSRIATEDWDGIIISHNLFTNLPMSPESYNEFYREQLDELDAAIRQMKSDEFGKMDKRSVTALENAKENLENRLKRDVSEDKKEVVIPFEELGIDQIFVDEADKFKNLAFHTSMGRLSGISTTNAKRSTDMYVKTRYMTKTYGRGIVFATGTPISNSMNEMFTMQRYLDADKLKDLGMNHFDSWAAMFGRKKDESEPSPDGNGFRMVTKLKFTNLQVLGKIYRSFADIKLPEDLPYLKRPKLKNGSRTVISVESTDAFDELKQTLVERTDAIRSGRPMTRTKKDGSTYEDNMLAVTNDFRTASLDMRLIDPTLSAEEAGAKVAALCDTVKRKYDETTPVSGAQVIFADIGTPKPQKDTGATDDESVMVEETAENITVYDEIKKELIKRGIPANEIGFVHDGKNPTQRQALFDKVNEGKLRVFIGSTETMGAGTNFQHHLVALHHLDCPWKPRDVEQREGRILRAGNENPEVEIFTYVTKGSYDANMWDKVRYKQQMIDSVMRGDPAAEEMDDISSNSSAEYGDIEAIAMDNPLMAEKVNLDAEVMRLKSLESSYNKEQRRMRGELQKLPAQIEQAKADAGRASADIKDRVSTKGDDFRMKLGDKVYTKRADATKALEAIDKSFRKPVSTKIGEIGGFEIHMRFDQAYIENLGGGQVVHGRNVIQLVNHGSYTAEPSVSSMEYALSHAPEKALHNAEVLLKKSEERLKGLNEEVGKPFKQKEQLDAAVKRQQEIQKQLDEANKPKEVQGNESIEKTEAQESTQTERDQNQDTESRPGEEAAGREVGIDSSSASAGETANFTGGEFKHTKTGEMIPQAKLKDKVDADIYKKLNALAKNHGGYYSRVSKSFLFKETAKRDDFLKAAEAMLSVADTDTMAKLSISAYHGGPHDFETFSLDHIGEGEGSQAHGWGLYFAGERKTSEKYRLMLNGGITHGVRIDGKVYHRKELEDEPVWLDEEGNDVWDYDTMFADFYAFNGYDKEKTIEAIEQYRKQANTKNADAFADKMLSYFDEHEVEAATPGTLFQVEIPEEDVLLDEQKPYSKQSEKVRNSIKKAFDSSFIRMFEKADLNGGEIYKELVNWLGSPKAASERLNKHGIKGITYDGRQDGRCYVVFDDQAIDIIGKFSASGEIRKILAGIQMVDNEELNSQQRKISEIGEAMGVPVVWIDADSRLNGFHSKGVTFLNRKAGMSLQKTFWHEQFHWLRNNNDDLWQELLTYFKGKDAFSKKQIEAYQKKTGRYDLTSDEAVIEEMLADAFMDVSRRVPIMKELARDDRSLAQKLVAWIKDMMNRFVEMFHNPEGRLTTEQRDIFVEAFGKLARDMVDADGKKIFKVYDDGKTIRLADGSELAGVRLSTGKKKFSIDNSDNAIYNKIVPMDADERNNAITRSVVDEFNKEVQRLVDEGWTDEQISRALNDENSDVRKNILKPWIREYNQYHAQNPDKKTLVNRAFRGKDVCAGQNYRAIDKAYRTFKDRVERMMDDAKLVFAECVDSRNRGQVVVGYDSWRAVEQSIARHGGQAEFKERPKPKLSVNLNNETTEGRSESQDASSIGENERGWFDRIYERFGKSAGIKAGKIIVEEREKGSNDIGLADYVAGSPSRIAEKVKMFRQFFHMGDKAMNTLTKNRSDFARKLEQAMNLVKNKEDREDLFNVLLIGDAEGKEYTKQQLMEEEGVSGNVADAYIRIRRLMTKAYHMVNDAKRRPQMHSRRMTDKEIMDLKDNKFVEIKSVHEAENGKKLVSYKEYANWEKSYTVDAETLARFEQDDAMQVLGYEQNEDGSYKVDVREAVPPVNKLTGYIPHFFHDYMIRVKDADGNYVAPIGSGRTENDAIKKAEEWLKKNELEDGQQVYIAPKAFSFDSLGMDESQYAAVMGDTDFDRMMNSIAEKNDMTLEEAKEMMKGSVKKKNRHRFFGNLLHRKGVAGYEQDLNWVLRHYFNSASRYAAMETEFKPKAISLFERYFGDFKKDHTGLAKYTKDYINDINGDPTALEDAINKSLNKSELWRKLVVSNFGDRAALQLANTVTNWTSMLCLGYLNASSAILNFTQAINATAYLGSASAGGDIFKYGFKRKYGLGDMRVLVETNVMNDIGLDSGSGYDTNRGYTGSSLSMKNKVMNVAENAAGVLGKISNKGMILFKLSEGAMRRGTVLAAYHKAINEGKSHAEAIAYAKEINRKSNFDYGVADAPNIFRRGSIFSQLALQFKKYAFKELEVMGDMLPMFSNATNSKQKMMFWGMYFLACGLMQVPAIDWLDEMLGLRDIHMKDFVQKSIMEACGDSAIGKALAKTAMYGLPAIAGVDISDRAGMANAISLPKSPTDVMGPAIGRAADIFFDSLAAIFSNGSVADVIRDISPGLYNQYVAWYAGQETGARGRVNTRYEGAYERILKAAGFKTTDKRIASDIQRITYNERSRLTKEKQAAVDAYLADPTTENAMKLRELGVKPDTVKKERERKKADRLGRVQAGMSKEERERYGDLMKFAE